MKIHFLNEKLLENHVIYNINNIFDLQNNLSVEIFQQEKPFNFCEFLE